MSGNDKARLDWFGVQYYVDPLIDMFKGSTHEPGGKMVPGMPFRFFPQGLITAIRDASFLKDINGEPVPIIISESGIADLEGQPSENSQGIEHMQKVHQVIQRALDLGYNVVGLYDWCLSNNWEWGRKGPEFGKLNADGSLKPQGELFKKISLEWQRVRQAQLSTRA